MTTSKRFHLTVFATLVCVLLSTAANVARAEGWALVFAPQYKALPAGPHQQDAANQLKSRLANAGIPAANIKLVVGVEATAERFREALRDVTNSVSETDLYVVVLCGHGLQFDDADYICTADTPANVEAEVRGQGDRLLKTSDILEEMSIAPSMRQLLILDGSGVRDGPLLDASLRFGRSQLLTTNGQWLIVNRSRRLKRRVGGPKLSSFMWSLLDGVADHADGNRDGRVSLLELTDYMKLYAEENDDIPPRIAGKVGADAQLLRATASNDASFPAKQLTRNASQLTAEASEVLLFDLNAEAAIAMLDRAKRLCRDAVLRRTIDRHIATARILKGEMQLVPRVNNDKAHWVAVLPQAVRVPEGTLPVGTIVHVTVNDSVNLLSEPVAMPKQTAQGVVYEAVKAPFRDSLYWIPHSLFKPESEQAIPNNYLRRRLAVIGAKDTQLAGDAR